MHKPLTQAEESVLQSAQGTPLMALLRRVVQEEMDHIDSVMNIDPNGNMGLQSLAAQKSYTALNNLFTKLKLADPANPQQGKKGPRQYQ